MEKKQTVHQGKGIASYSKGKSLDTLDLSRRNGEAIDLKSISLRGTNLRDANLTEAQLSGADLSSATLMDVDSYDHWYCVRFDGANLRRAKVDLSYIDKSMPHLKGATLPKGILPRISVKQKLLYLLVERIGHPYMLISRRRN